MAASLPRFLKKLPFSSSLPLLRGLGASQLPQTSPLPLPLLQEPPLETGRTSTPPNGEGSPPNSFRRSSLIIPNFRLAYLLDPVVHLPFSGELDREKGDAVDEEPTVWADSVKKKRKRKMNKHKLRKLRRMLRRKT